MPYSIGLYFDQKTETIVRNSWLLLAEKGLADYYLVSGNRPHITVRIYDDLKTSEAERILGQFSQSKNPISISFQQIGLFNGSVSTVFWAPVVTRELLEIHLQLESLFCRMGAISGSAYYAPGNWIPHCGLAMEIKQKEFVPQIIEISQTLPNPHQAQITEIGLIKFRPVEHLFSFSLRG